jgi:hypothetical protein
LFLAAGLRGDDVKICDLLKKGTDEVLRSLWEFSNRSAAELSLNIDNLRQLTIEQLRGELQGMAGLDRLLARRGVSDAYVFLGTYFTALADMPFVHFGRYVTASLFECIGTVREAYKQTMVKMGIVSADGDHDDEYGDDGSSRRTWTSMTSQSLAPPARAPSSVRDLDDAAARTHVSVRPEDSVSNVVLAQSQAQARASKHGTEPSDHRAKDSRHAEDGAFTRNTQNNDRLAGAGMPAKIDDGQDRPRADMRDPTRLDARDHVRTDARDQARTEARDQARTEARDQARTEARDQARTEARDQARTEARDQARTEARDQVDDDSRAPSLARGPRRADVVSDAGPDAEHVITHITRQDLQDLHGNRDRDGGRSGPSRNGGQKEGGQSGSWSGDAEAEGSRAPPKVPVPSRVQSGQTHGTWHASAAPPSQRPSLAVVRAPNQFDADADGRYAGLAASTVSTLSTHRPTPSDAGSKLFEKLGKLRSVTYDEHGDPRTEEEEVEEREEVGRRRKHWDS